MKLSRRNFVGATTAALVGAPLLNSARAAVGNDDPLNVRSDFPLLKTTNFVRRQVYLDI